MIQEAVARQIVIDSNQVRPGVPARKGFDLGFADARVEQEAVQRVAGPHPAGQQVEAQPAPLIFMPGLIGQWRGGEGFSDVLGLDERRRRVDPADRGHGAPDSVALVDQRSKKADNPAMRDMPVRAKSARS